MNYGGGTHSLHSVLYGLDQNFQLLKIIRIRCLDLNFNLNLSCMSGIYGIINFDGAPLNREMFSSMTENLKHRAKDSAGQWIGEGVGLGHGMTFITPEDKYETCRLNTNNG